jgi:hypothetical protein
LINNFLKNFVHEDCHGGCSVLAVVVAWEFKNKYLAFTEISELRNAAQVARLLSRSYQPSNRTKRLTKGNARRELI